MRYDSVYGAKRASSFAFAMAAIILALALSAGCTLFQSDPVGASLYTVKTGYESSVRTAGALYLNKFIDDKQLNLFRVEATKVYNSYVAALSAHETGMNIPSEKMDALLTAVAGLQSLAQSYSKQAGQ